jgi:hypothetical protein
MLPELTDEQQETLFQCFQRELNADLNVWKPVFAFWLSEFVRWWNKNAGAMQKLLEEMVSKIVLGGALAVAARKALTKIITAIIATAFPEVSATDIAVLAGFAVSLFVGGIALGTVADALARCWGVQFPDDPLNVV